ncbi:DUF1127 domain-containing protein [Sedimentitalea sp. CY04]|uniref:DUF1127 domain-containing protein n=1 Tax=Parasedimentitalea denitrificans TaxID=2211118 RepID=A0ABX0W7T3_9RHOB|nr:DUF1127 domain-containing protein [Sedimentitalea sp. CY04]
MSPLAALKRSVAAIFTGLVNVAEANPRYLEVQKLQAMTDEQLAAKGLKRDDIVMHVFGRWM